MYWRGYGRITKSKPDPLNKGAGVGGSPTNTTIVKTYFSAYWVLFCVAASNNFCCLLWIARSCSRAKDRIALELTRLVDFNLWTCANFS